MFGWQNGEHSQQTGWGRELPRKREFASTVEFGSGDRLDPWVPRRADRGAKAARGQLYSWWQQGKKCSHSYHLQRLCGHSPAVLYRGRRASWGLASDDGVQVWALVLHWSAEDPLHSATAAWWRQRMVGQLHHHSPHGLSSTVGWIPRCFPSPLHPRRRDEEEAPGVYGSKVRRKVRAGLLHAV
jgi:hypothetical protein